MVLGNGLFVIAFWGIWAILLYWVFLSIGAVFYAWGRDREALRMRYEAWPQKPPFVSAVVPAHNEALVIEATVRALARQSYPQHRFEIVIIDDGSSDGTGELVEDLARLYPNVMLVRIPVGKGGKGKSRTLNLGMEAASGEIIAVFDADNTPERDFLLLAVKTLILDKKLIAVNGKVRTRNHSASWLTRFINLEFIYFQWLFQGGRWYWFRLSTLMGTGYVIYRDALETLGGFDEASLVDDTEMSLRIFKGGFRIRWVPYAVTWEQEPEEFSVWLRQRTRWVQGNFSVILKYLAAGLRKPYPLGLEIMAMLLSYAIFLPALSVSYAVLALSLSNAISVTLPGPFSMLWALAVTIYSVHMCFVITIEDRKPFNYFLGLVSYFTYAQLFIVVVVRAIYTGCQRKFRRAEISWVKTVRSQEKQ